MKRMKTICVDDYWIYPTTSNFTIKMMEKGEIVNLNNSVNENKKVIFLGKPKTYTYEIFYFFDIKNLKILKLGKDF